ncbi:hypothetical protein BV22DRAFT_1084783 [Leucogyrophana mollusca]|uniref:Uncharacterized protein n=1 Tax=Leucogyrophana mollusca TaxID=85980 RepID=A0ACB8BQD9_9AGAM|nr:hypothetical protein BV22DRAFT_1084783 [Leucogyrophana mollusca]
MLSAYLLPGPSEAYYVPDFVTPEEEAYLLRKIEETPRQKWKTLGNRRCGVRPRLWGEVLQRSTLFRQEMPSFLSHYPDILGRLRATKAFECSPHQGPNHVILNEYMPGQGIMPHEDGPSYHPVVATLSLGSHAVFHYYRYKGDELSDKAFSSSTGKGRAIDPNPVLSVLLEPRSVIITTGALYTSHLHGIEEIGVDAFRGNNMTPLSSGNEAPIANSEIVRDPEMRSILQGGGELKRNPRYSLTCRDVEKVAGTRSLMSIH